MRDRMRTQIFERSLKGNPVRTSGTASKGGGGGVIEVPGLYPYDLIAFYPDVPEGAEILWSFLADRDVAFPAQLAGSMAGAESAPGIAVTLTVRKNGGTVGEIRFGPGETAGSFNYFPAFGLVAGDEIDLVMQATPAATLSGIKVTLCGSRPSAGESGALAGSPGPKGDAGIPGFMATAVGSVGLGVAVYVPSSGSVAPGDCTDLTKCAIAGVARAAAPNGLPVAVIGSGAVVADALLGATPGDLYYLGAGGTPVLYAALPAGARIIQIGIALTALNLLVSIRDLGRRA